MAICVKETENNPIKIYHQIYKCCKRSSQYNIWINKIYNTNIIDPKQLISNTNDKFTELVVYNIECLGDNANDILCILLELDHLHIEIHFCEEDLNMSKKQDRYMAFVFAINYDRIEDKFDRVFDLRNDKDDTRRLDNRCVIYLSTFKQDDNIMIDYQISKCKQYCEENGLYIVKIYKD